jgi:hypothetical protein
VLIIDFINCYTQGVTMAAANYVYGAEALYLAYFGRPADTGGLNSFTSTLAQADTGGTATTLAGLAQAVASSAAIAGLVNSFAISEESIALHGGSSVMQIVDAIYHNLFNRSADLDGLLYWSDEIYSGNLTLPAAALNILAGAQGEDAAIANNKIAAASLFTSKLGENAEADAAFNGNAAAAIARDFLATVDQTTNLSGEPFQQALQTTLNNLILQHDGAGSGGAPLDLHLLLADSAVFGHDSAEIDAQQHVDVQLVGVAGHAGIEAALVF